jgi:hypothetical protein
MMKAARRKRRKGALIRIIAFCLKAEKDFEK